MMYMYNIYKRSGRDRVVEKDRKRDKPSVSSERKEVRVIVREREKTEKDAISITERRDKKKKREKTPGRRRGVEKLTFYARGLWFSRGLPTNQSFSCARFLFFSGTLTAHTAAV